MMKSQLFYIYNYTMVKVRLFFFFFFGIVLLTVCIFYEPAMTTTKLPLVGWLKFLNWTELNWEKKKNDSTPSSCAKTNNNPVNQWNARRSHQTVIDDKTVGFCYGSVGFEDSNPLPSRHFEALVYRSATAIQLLVLVDFNGIKTAVGF